MLATSSALVSDRFTAGSSQSPLRAESQPTGRVRRSEASVLGAGMRQGLLRLQHPGPAQGKGLPLDSLCCPQEGSDMSMEAATLPLESTPTHEDAAPSRRAGTPRHPLTRS